MLCLCINKTLRVTEIKQPAHSRIAAILDSARSLGHQGWIAMVTYWGAEGSEGQETGLAAGEQSCTQVRTGVQLLCPPHNGQAIVHREGHREGYKRDQISGLTQMGARFLGPLQNNLCQLPFQRVGGDPFHNTMSDEIWEDNTLGKGMLHTMQV